MSARSAAPPGDSLSHDAADPAGIDGRWGARLRFSLSQLPVFALPLFTALIQILGTLGSVHSHSGHPGTRPLDALAWVLLVLGPAALTLARRYPVGVLAVCTLCVAVYITRGYAVGPIYISYVVALIWAIVQGRHVYAWCSVPVLFITEYVVPATFAGARWPSLSTFGGDLAWAVACLALAEGVNFRRQRAQATTRARQEQARRQSSDERLAIARELHDVLAHSISLINVQAGTALEVMDRRPEQARVALEAIKHTSKQALTEVRSVLDAIRGPDAPSGAPLVPTAGLAQLDSLVSRARATGLDVRLEISGTVVPLPAGVDLAAYRIVQEALTNVVRHAQASTVTARIAYEPDAVRLRIVDDGRGYSAGDVDGSGEGGNGLPGMRERALALGGDFSVQTLRPPERGFEVAAALPLHVVGDGGGNGGQGGGTG